jgi:hypothetical protein
VAQKLNEQYGYSYDNLKVLLGGWIAWTDRNISDPAGYPIESSTDTSGSATAETGTSDPEAIGRQLMDQVDVKSPLVSPDFQILEHDPNDGYVAAHRYGIDVYNFVAIAIFTNPYDASEHSWDYGLIFRDVDAEEQFRLIITPSRNWYLQVVNDGVNSGELPNLNLESGATNGIALVANGDTGYLFFQGQGSDFEYVAELDLSDISSSGDISVGTGFYNDNEVAGSQTLSLFTLYELAEP